MVNPGALVPNPDFARYKLQYQQLVCTRLNWTQVVLTKRNNESVLENNYIDSAVLVWLQKHVGERVSHSRSAKRSWGEGWAYTMDEDHRHVFMFEKASDALVFKLTWA